MSSDNGKTNHDWRQESESRRQHLEFIQNVITRMNTNSFQLKGLAVAIVTALVGIYATTSNVIFVFLGIVPTLFFWFLDGYYLLQERKFRGVYNDVIGLKNDIEVKPYEMPIHKYTVRIGKQYSYWNVFFSQTILWLYFPVIALLIIIGVLLRGDGLTGKAPPPVHHIHQHSTTFDGSTKNSGARCKLCDPENQIFDPPNNSEKKHG